LHFCFPGKYLLYYHINDADFKPTGRLIYKIFDSGMVYFLKLEKIVENKLGYPYNHCSKSDDLPGSLYIRKESKIK